MFKISNNSYFITYPYHEKNTKIYDSYNTTSAAKQSYYSSKSKTKVWNAFDKGINTTSLTRFKENGKIELLTSYWINHCFPFLNVCTLMYA